jgi:hypothetical protein
MALSTPQTATQLVTQLALRLTSGDKEPIRGMKMDDGRTVFSVYDAMWNTSAYGSKKIVSMAFSRLLSSTSEHKEEVASLMMDHCCYIQFPGQGQRDTPCMDIRGLQRLISLLGGKIGAEYRALAETTLTRLVAGDESMISEIEDNAASDAPIHVLAREALAHEPLLADAQPTVEINDDTKAEDDKEDERMVLVRNIAATVATLGQQSSGLAADVRQFAPLVPIVQRLTEEVTLLRVDRDHQARLRHQADGRYGSEVREANKGVRDLADHWKRQAEKQEKRSDEKDQMILECHRLFARAMATQYRERSRSPRS